MVAAALVWAARSRTHHVRCAAWSPQKVAALLASLVCASLWPRAGDDYLHAQAFSTPTGPPSPDRKYPVNPDDEPRPVLRALRVNAPIVVDGALDEGDWSRAEVASKFVQSTPRTGYAASLDTEVRILYDAGNLYVGAVLRVGPGGLVTAGLEQDFHPQRGDLFGITLDPFLDRRSSYVFATNPGGAQRDEQTFDNSRTIISAWSAVMETSSRVADSTWTVEMRIPFNTISFDPLRDGQPWGLNIIRMGGGNGEISHWAPLPARDIAHRMVKAGYLVGLSGLERGRSLRVKPFALSTWRNGSLVSPDDRGSAVDAGIDVKYGVKPKLVLDLTYRMDFSHVESDQAQLNLSRFSVFFPERREFFIENQGTFTFGDIVQSGLRSGTTTQDFTLFHSRRIGLTAAGRPIPLLGGARLTGRAGPIELGVATLASEPTSAGPGELFTVARFKNHVMSASDVGVLFTERRATSGDSSGTRSRSVGADANFRLKNRLYISSYVAASEAGGAQGAAGRVLLGWRDDIVNSSVMYRQITKYFDPTLGFLRRGGIRHYYSSVGLHPRPRAYGVSEINPYIEASYITDIAGRLESREFVGAMATRFVTGASFDLIYRDRLEITQARFTIFRDVLVEPGEYHFEEGVLAYRFPTSRTLSASMTLTYGGFYDGTRRAATFGGAWRPIPNLYMSLDLERNAVRLPQRSFLADLATLRTEHAWSTRLFGTLLMQYDSQRNEVVANARLSFRYSPLSDLFVVYEERRAARGRTPNAQGLTFKVTKLFQL